MFDPSFYELTPGSMGKLFYKRNTMSEDEKQAYVSKMAGERMRAFLMNSTYGMNANGPTDPQEAYNKARRDSWNELDGGVGAETLEIYVQIGQKESMDLITKIESSQGFVCWADPDFVNQIKQRYNEDNRG